MGCVRTTASQRCDCGQAALRALTAAAEVLAREQAPLSASDYAQQPSRGADDANLLSLAVEAARQRCTVGEISDALEGPLATRCHRSLR